MAKKLLAASLEPDVYADFARVANAAHMASANAFAALILSRFSQLKQEFALHALTSIPQDFFKRPAGRPASAATRPDRDPTPGSENVLEHAPRLPVA